MAKEKIKKLVIDEPVEEIVAEKETIVAKEETVTEPTATFADTIDPTPKVAATVALAIRQAQDRLARDKANFPQI